MVKDWANVFRKVKAALMRRGRTADDADDLVQDAWLRFESYQRVKVVEDPDAFLMKTALNLSIDMHRGHVSHGDEVQLEDVVILDASPTAEDILLARERKDRLTLGLTRLTEKSREIFLAYRLEGMTYKEIAQRHGVSVSTVEKHVARATVQLTAWMQGW